MTGSGVLIASTLTAPLVDGPRQQLHALHRSRLAWQLADGGGKVVASLHHPDAVRLPHAVIVSSLPDRAADIWVGGGAWGWHGDRMTVGRWWVPARPRVPALRQRVDERGVERLEQTWRQSLGRGDGLTPYGDDVICGAIVTLHAAGHPAARRLSAAVLQTDLEHATTATSAGLLRYAAEGFGIDQLASYLRALGGRCDDSVKEANKLQDIGHSSGRGLLEGVASMLGRADDMMWA